VKRETKFVPPPRKLTEAERGQIQLFTAINNWKPHAIAQELGVRTDAVRQVQRELGLSPNSTHALPPDTVERIRTQLAKGHSVSEICRTECVLAYRVYQIKNEKRRKSLTAVQKRLGREEFYKLTKALAAKDNVPAVWYSR
jgi:hypothetical protein